MLKKLSDVSCFIFELIENLIFKMDLHAIYKAQIEKRLLESKDSACNPVHTDVIEHAVLSAAYLGLEELTEIRNKLIVNYFAQGIGIRFVGCESGHIIELTRWNKTVLDDDRRKLVALFTSYWVKQILKSKDRDLISIPLALIPYEIETMYYLGCALQLYGYNLRLKIVNDRYECTLVHMSA